MVFGQKFLFEIGKESTVVLVEKLLDAIEIGKKPFFLMKDIAEGIGIPSLDSVSESCMAEVMLWGWLFQEF